MAEVKLRTPEEAGKCSHTPLCPHAIALHELFSCPAIGAIAAIEPLGGIP